MTQRTASRAIHNRFFRFMFFAGFVLSLPALAVASEKQPFSGYLEAPERVDFLLPDSAGTQHQLSDYRGHWVIVNFWATWCGPCVREMPALQKLADANENLVLIGVNFEEIETDALDAAIEKLEIRYLIVRAGDEPILPFEPLKGLPSTFFLNPAGEIVYRHTGELSHEDLNAVFTEVQKRDSRQ